MSTKATPSVFTVILLVRLITMVKTMNPVSFCGSLTDDLKRYGGIKLAIKEQSEKLDRVKQEINESKKQKQEVLATATLQLP